MTQRTTRPLSVERLEVRDCPALTLRLLPGSLNILGTPTGTLTVLETAANTFQVQDGATTIATFANVSNINIRLPRRPTDIDITLNGNDLTGNLLMDLGFGDTSGPPSTINIHGGTVRGFVTMLIGSGNETYNLGTALGGGIDALTVRGDVNAVAKTSAGIGLGNPRDTLILDQGSTILRDLRTTSVDSVLLVDTTTVGRNLVINNALEHTIPDINLFGANIGQDVSVVGPTTGMTVTVLSLAPGVGTIGRNITVQGLGGNTQVALLNNPTVGGDIRVSTGVGNDFVLLQADVGGNALVSTGEGDDLILFDTLGLVAGNLSINGGNGANTIFSDGTVSGDLSFLYGNGNNLITVNGTVAGNMRFNLGNGANTVTAGQAPGGVLFWQSGNGTNTLTLGGAATAGNSQWNVNARFGNGDDTLILDAAASASQILSGFLDFGGRVLRNTFTQSAPWVLSPNLTLANLP